MLIDCHCHILPQIDDGSKSTEMSLNMIALQHQQGVETIIATPHFHAHREKSIEDYLQKRQTAFEKIMAENPAVTDIRLGAEVAVEHGLSRIPGIEKLAYQGTKLFLFEFPYSRFDQRYIEEIYNICNDYGLTPVIAHLHRYLDCYTKSEMKKVLEMNAIIQCNNEAFGNFKERHFVKKILKKGYRVVFGSDAHNLDSRKPNFDLLVKKAKPEWIDNANQILSPYLQKTP